MKLDKELDQRLAELVEEDVLVVVQEEAETTLANVNLENFQTSGQIWGS